MSATEFVLILSFGITFNLLLVSHLMRGRRREVKENYRRQDEVARLAAEAVRLLAVNQDVLLAATDRVADRLMLANQLVADKLQVATASSVAQGEEILVQVAANAPSATVEARHDDDDDGGGGGVTA